MDGRIDCSWAFFPLTCCDIIFAWNKKLSIYILSFIIHHDDQPMHARKPPWEKHHCSSTDFSPTCMTEINNKSKEYKPLQRSNFQLDFLDISFIRSLHLHAFCLPSCTAKKTPALVCGNYRQVLFLLHFQIQRCFQHIRNKYILLEVWKTET